MVLLNVLDDLTVGRVTPLPHLDIDKQSYLLLLFCGESCPLDQDRFGGGRHGGFDGASRWHSAL